MSEMGLIQRVAKLSVSIFRQCPLITGSEFDNSIAQLRCLMDQLTELDVAFDRNWLSEQRPVNQKANKPLMTYVPMLQHEHVTIGIFILPSGTSLPTHDHPDMYGFMKVVYGRIRMQSYSSQQFTGKQSSSNCNITQEGDAGRTGYHLTTSGNSECKNNMSIHLDPDKNLRSVKTTYGTAYYTRKMQPEILTSADRCMLLTPDVNNFHEITAIDGPAAFLDVLAPPYDNEEHIFHTFTEIRPALFHKVFGSDRVFQEGWLLQVPDCTFFSNYVQYKGPSLESLDL